MKHIVLAGTAALTLAGCAGGNAYTGVDAGPVAAAEPAPVAAPIPAPIPVPDNPLLAEWTGPYGGVPPWDKVKVPLFAEAFQFGIDEQRREIMAIVDNPEPPTFANTIEAIEKSGERLNRVQTLFDVLTNNLATPDVQAVDKEWSPKLTAASDEITLNPQLFQRIKAVYEARAALNPKQQRLVTRYYDGFVRNGANLNPEQKKQLSAYNQELATLFSTFSEKVLADESTYITAMASDLKGVPQDVKKRAATDLGIAMCVGGKRNFVACQA